MKKNIFLVCLLTVSVFAYSQLINSSQTSTPKLKINSAELRAAKKMSAAKTNSVLNSTWFNYGIGAENAYGITSDYSSSYLFPDSTGYVEFAAGIFEPVWVHHIAELIDFRSIVFQVNPTTDWVFNNPNDPIKIDSLSIVYAYTRTQNVTDTLIITVFDGPLTGLGTYSLSGMLNTAYNYGFADTISYKMLGYNQPDNSIAAASNTATPPAGQTIYKILLTQSDTAIAEFREKAFMLPMPFTSYGNRLVCADVQFKPGYTNYLMEHINYTANVFQFASLEENGNAGNTGTYMTYNDCGFGSALCDYSQSYIISKQSRYNQVGNGWNGYFLPTLAFTAPYAYEHHLISFHVSNDMTNICLVNSQFSVVPDSVIAGNYSAYNNSTGTGTLSYLWDFGDGTNSTLQYPSHQYAVPGQYVVCLTTSATSGTATCSSFYCDSSSVQRVATGFLMSQFNVIPPSIITSIKQQQKDLQLNAFPNPIADELTIEVNSLEAIALNYTLVDALGRSILSGMLDQSSLTINTTQLSKGFYTLHITNKNGASCKDIKLAK
jgi:hypothetical protein